MAERGRGGSRRQRRCLPGRRSRLGAALAAGSLALCACALLLGCSRVGARKSAPLAPAGSARDDGRGVLARISAGRALTRRAEPARGPAASKPERGDADGAGADDADDGTSYGGHTIDRSPRPHSAPLPYARRYAPFAPAEYGSIEGVVQWLRPPRAPERLLPVGSNPASRGAGCRGGIPNQSLAVTGGSGVANAVVYLEDVATGRTLLGRANASYPNPTKHMQIGGVLEWRACRFHPQVQVVAPVGSVLSLSTADEVIKVSAARVDGRSRQELWSVSLGARGSAHEHLLERDGFLELRAETTGYAATSWVVVAPHPYFAVTDERGHFALDQIPPGNYTLVVWHEPVVVGFSRSGAPMTHTPSPIRRRVAVSARQGQRLTIRLQPAQ